jgi:hypothetical protein
MNKIIDKINLLPNYHVLHDSEFPMLMLGENVLGEYVIASFLEEDDAVGQLKYFHVFADESVLLAFLKGNIAYLDVMKSAEAIFLVVKSYNYSILNVKKVAYSDLSKDMLPLKSSFFPKAIQSVFMDLEKRINAHKVIVEYA